MNISDSMNRFDWARDVGRHVTALNIATAASVGVGALAFSLSFTALSELAAQNGVSPGQAWMLPLVVDGLVVVSTAASAKLQGWRSTYPWILLVIGTAISVWGNVMHASTNGFGAIGMAIAAIPPLVLLAVSHLTILLARQTQRDQTVEESVAEVIEEPATPKAKKAKKAQKAKKAKVAEVITPTPLPRSVIEAPRPINGEIYTPIG